MEILCDCIMTCTCWIALWQKLGHFSEISGHFLEEFDTAHKRANLHRIMYDWFSLLSSGVISCYS